MSLVVQNLSKTFDVLSGVFLRSIGKVQALKNVGFSVKIGESLGIVGESGSGKTTLAKILAGFYPPDSGTVHYREKDILLPRPRAVRARLVQMVFQDPFSSLNPKLLLGTQINEAGPVVPAEELMEDVGLSPDFLHRYPHQISGGQRQRFAIARALAAHPDILIADEPVSSLDLSTQVQIVKLINALRRKRKFTLLVISHDLAIVSHLCDHMIVMKEGEIVESGSTENVLKKPRELYTRRLLAAVPSLT